MRIHSDLSGKEDYGEYGTLRVPRRLYIFTDHFGTLIIGARTQAWLPILGAMPPKWYWWWFIVWHPNNRKPGLLARRHPEWYGLKK